jgi:RimJ/RimL family protein N-acetyltransferase
MSMRACIKALVVHFECLLSVDLKTLEGRLQLQITVVLVGACFLAPSSVWRGIAFAALLFSFSECLLRPWSIVLPKGASVETSRLMIRPPHWRDRARVADIWLRRQSYQVHGLSREVVFWKQLALKSPILFRELRSNTLVGIERKTGQLVGVVVVGRCQENGGASHSLGLDVHPGFRKQGYGCELMAAGIYLAQKRGWPVWVGTSKSNDAMRRIMSDLGYVQTKIRKHALPNGRRCSSIWYECRAVPFGVGAADLAGRTSRSAA